MTAEQFGPARWNPNDMLALDDETVWQSLCEAFGDTYCNDRRVMREPSAAERDMARLTATFPGIADPVNTVALQTAPVVAPKRNHDRLIGWGIVAGVATLVTLGVIGAVNVALWVLS